MKNKIIKTTISSRNKIFEKYIIRKIVIIAKKLKNRLIDNYKVIYYMKRKNSILRNNLTKSILY